MPEVVLFVLALFGVPWVLDWIFSFFLPPPYDQTWKFLATFVPTVWSPTFIALAFVAVAGGAAGVRAELKARLRYQPGSARWLFLAAVVPVLFVCVALFGARAAGLPRPFIAADGVLQMLGLQVITGAIGEELGWRGFLLSRLRKHVGVIAAAWTMGILWSLWHLPAFFTPGMPHQTWPMLIVLPFIAFFGVFMAYLFNRTGESVLATMTAHLLLNIMLGVGGTTFRSSMFWGILAILFGVVAVLASIQLRARQDARGLAHDIPRPFPQ